ncbi:MAG: hypothetical protein WA821_20085 [Anaerolineales bacterium]
MESSTSEFLVIVEAPADYKTATQIAERTISEYGPEWLKEILETRSCSLYVWKGLESNTDFSCWRSIYGIDERFAQAGDGYLPLYTPGHGRNSPGYDYPIGLKILWLVKYLNGKKKRNINAILLIRDADSRSHAQERLKSLDALREPFRLQKIQAIIGFAIPEREAWVLNGFEAQNPGEKQRLKQIKDEIKFDPCQEAHRLRGKRNQPGTEARDIKSILETLTGGDPLREEACWLETPLATLQEHGQETGLADYIQEVHNHLLPVLTGSH